MLHVMYRVCQKTWSPRFDAAVLRLFDLLGIYSYSICYSITNYGYSICLKFLSHIPRSYLRQHTKSHPNRPSSAGLTAIFMNPTRNFRVHALFLAHLSADHENNCETSTARPIWMKFCVLA